MRAAVRWSILFALLLATGVLTSCGAGGGGAGLILAFLGGGQLVNGVMNVRVMDMETGLPVPDATVFLGQDGTLAAAQAQTTDASGRATFVNLTGPQTVTATVRTTTAAGFDLVFSMTLVEVDARTVVIPTIAPAENATLDGTVSGPGTLDEVLTNAGGYGTAAGYVPPNGYEIDVRTRRRFTVFAVKDDGIDQYGVFTFQGPLADNDARTVDLAAPVVSNFRTPAAGQVSFGGPWTASAETRWVVEAFVPGQLGTLGVGAGTLDGSSASPRSQDASYVPVPGVGQVIAHLEADETLGGDNCEAEVYRLISSTAAAMPSVALPTPPTSLTITAATVTPQIDYTLPGGAEFGYMELAQNAGAVVRMWIVLLPPSRTTFTVPTMPTTVTSHGFVTGAGLNVSVSWNSLPTITSFDYDDFNYTPLIDHRVDTDEAWRGTAFTP